MGKKITFPELKKVEVLTLCKDPLLSSRLLGMAQYPRDRRAVALDFPIYGLSIGSQDKDVPCLGLFGGVHGLEKIGTQVIISFLQSFLVQLTWDQALRKVLQECRIVTIPIVNPVGMFLRRRSNGQRVDLMRNAPVESLDPSLWPFSGQRYSRHIPWFRGKEGGPMELEAQILVDFVREELFPSPSAIAIDFHSGFGMRDRLWYPYAKTKAPFPRQPQAERIRSLLRQTYPHHIYKVEPQSRSYTTHGDLWDYLFDEHYQAHPPPMSGSSSLGPWRWGLGFGSRKIPSRPSLAMDSSTPSRNTATKELCGDTSC